MDKLFAEIKVEDYFQKIISLINHEIDNYSKKTMEILDVDAIADQLFHVFSSSVPKLIKEKTNSFITAVKSEETPHPTGINFGEGEENTMDIANYTIPFSGPPIFFKCIPRKSSGNTIEARVYNGEILIQLTSGVRMIGNERIQNHIKEQFLERVHQIEDSLALLQEDLDQFSESLKPEIQKRLRKRQVAQC